MEPKEKWGSSKERETRLRILLTLAAYAYEFEPDYVFCSDADYDYGCKMVDCRIETDRPDLDLFFRNEFHADTGQWIRKHPELDKVDAALWRYLKANGLIEKHPRGEKLMDEHFDEAMAKLEQLKKETDDDLSQDHC